MLYSILALLILSQFFLMLYILIPTFNTQAGVRDYTNIDLSWVRNTPNCVSSKVEQSSSYYIEPLPYYSKKDLSIIVAEFARISPLKIKYSSLDYIHFGIMSPIMRYVDDVELLREGDFVHIRSCSRVGYSDNGLNKKRIEIVRSNMSQSYTI